MRPTLKQIADECGISISTVSRIVTGKGYVSDEAREQVEAAMQRLGYRKKERTVSPLKDSSDMVMILVGGIRSSLAASMVEQLVRELEEKQKRAFIAVTSFSPEKELEYLRFAAENRFFGVLAMTITETPEILSYLRSYTIPVTMVDRYLPSLETDYLRPDYYRMGYTGAEYLIRRGHRRIAFVGGSKGSSITEDKLLGFEDCMHAYGLESRPEWVFRLNRLIFDNAKEVVDALYEMSEKPTAIVSSNDISVGIVNELQSHGWDIPRQISLFVCEDSTSAEHCQVPLTAMSVDSNQMAHDAVKTLIRRRRQPYGPRHFLIYNPQLVERSSVASLQE